MKAHELARQLLAGPDLEVWARNPTQPDYPLWVDSIEGEGEHCSCEDNEDLDEDDLPVVETVILLDLREDDGFIE